jgi:hypothetical protein
MGSLIVRSSREGFIGGERELEVDDPVSAGGIIAVRVVQGVNRDNS